MKVETTQTVKQEIDIPVPSFYSEKKYNGINHLIGVLDEKTVVSIFESNSRTHVGNNDLSISKIDVVNAFYNWQHIDEDEFMLHYNRALKSMSLTPELVIK